MAAPLFDKNPFLILWELTRACDLACRHCRASAVAERNPFELSLKECLRVLDQIQDLGSPLVVLTGGDPLKRPDVFDIVRAGSSRGLRMTMTPSGTPLLTDEAVQKLAGEGLARLAVSLDGPDAASHDGFRRVPGSFGHTWRGIEAAHKYGLPLQINTSFCRANLNAFEEMAELVRKAGAVLWSVFFVVPVGRASFEDELSADEFERLFEKMADLAGRVPFDIKSTAAPHYRRYLLQRNGRPTGPAADSRSAAGMVGGEGWRALRGVNDGNGLL
ncbi:MAG: radical SAM protein, partial [Bdellovibrionota bacterium]